MLTIMLNVTNELFMTCYAECRGTIILLGHFVNLLLCLPTKNRWLEDGGKLVRVQALFVER